MVGQRIYCSNLEERIKTIEHFWWFVGAGLYQCVRADSVPVFLSNDQ